MPLYMNGDNCNIFSKLTVQDNTYGLKSSDFIGVVDENGALSYGSEELNLSVGGFKSIASSMIFSYKFYQNPSLKSIVFNDLEEINTGYVFRYAFQSCSKLTSVSFPLLKNAYGGRNFDNAFSYCSNLTSVSFPLLEKIGATDMQGAFQDCTSLTHIEFPSLTDIENNAFGSGSGSSQFAFNRCTALAEIHFRADMEETIKALNGFSTQWGATNAIIIFDL